MRCRSAEALKRWKTMSTATVANRDTLPITKFMAEWTKRIEKAGRITKESVVAAYSAAVQEVGEPSPVRRNAAITLIGELAYYGHTFRTIARDIKQWPAGASK